MAFLDFAGLSRYHDKVKALIQDASAGASVVASFDDGTNWWRKFSDGWIEQGGRALVAPDGTTRIVFPAAFPTEVRSVDAISMSDITATYGVVSLTSGAVNFTHNGNGALSTQWIARGR